MLNRLRSRLTDVKRRFQVSEESSILSDLEKMLSDRGIDTITAQQLFDRLYAGKESVQKDYLAYLNELQKDQLDSINEKQGTGIIASDELRLSSDTELNASNTGYLICKEIGVNMAGIWRIKFSLKASSGDEAYGKIYKNGVALGTERENTTTAWVEYSEDLWFDVGDLVQLYTKAKNVGDVWYAKNFRLYGDFGQYYGSVVI